MARIRGYIGVSLDGFIADRNEELGWLYEHGGVEYGEFAYEHLLAEVSTMVMGRATFDWVRKEVAGWVYPDHDSIIVTSHPIENLPPRVTAWTDGVDGLVAHLRALDGKDVWIVGGGKLQSAFVDRSGLDFIEIFVVPILIGGGTPLWPGSDVQTVMEFEDARHVNGGVVRLAYRRKT